MKLHSNSFNDGERLDDKYTYMYDNISPHIAWSEIPDGAVEIAVICDDPDAPMGTWVHWIIWGIPSARTELPEGLDKHQVLADLGHAMQGKNNFGHAGYDGPAPPPGPDHRYIFHVYALSEAVNPGVMSTAQELRAAMSGKILDEAAITGTWSR